MYIDKLQYIVEVAKEKSIIKTSQKLHVSASVISQSITQLEKEWGLKIFYRTKIGTLPTEEGMAVIKKASEILAKYQELKDEIHIQSSSIKMKLQIACVPSLSDAAFDALLKFKNTFPDVDIYIKEMTWFEVLNEIKNGKSDIGFLPLDEIQLKSEVNVIYEKIFEGNPCICVRSDSILSQYEVVTPSDLLHENFVMYNAAYINHLFEKYLSTANILFTATNLEIIKRAVTEGLAIIFSYDKQAHKDVHVLSGKVVAIPFHAPGVTPQPFWSIYPRDKPSKVIQEFTNYMKSKFHSL